MMLNVFSLKEWFIQKNKNLKNTSFYNIYNIIIYIYHLKRNSNNVFLTHAIIKVIHWAFLF